jgi:hypothetical protein
LPWSSRGLGDVYKRQRWIIRKQKIDIIPIQILEQKLKKSTVIPLLKIW